MAVVVVSAAPADDGVAHADGRGGGGGAGYRPGRCRCGRTCAARRCAERAVPESSPSCFVRQ